MSLLVFGRRGSKRRQVLHLKAKAERVLAEAQQLQGGVASTESVPKKAEYFLSLTSLKRSRKIEFLREISFLTERGEKEEKTLFFSEEMASATGPGGGGERQLPLDFSAFDDEDDKEMEWEEYLKILFAVLLKTERELVNVERIARDGDYLRERLQALKDLVDFLPKRFETLENIREVFEKNFQTYEEDKAYTLGWDMEEPPADMPNTGRVLEVDFDGDAFPVLGNEALPADRESDSSLNDLAGSALSEVNGKWSSFSLKRATTGFVLNEFGPLVTVQQIKHLNLSDCNLGLTQAATDDLCSLLGNMFYLERLALANNFFGLCGVNYVPLGETLAKKPLVRLDLSFNHFAVVGGQSNQLRSFFTYLASIEELEYLDFSGNFTQDVTYTKQTSSPTQLFLDVVVAQSKLKELVMNSTEFSEFTLHEPKSLRRLFLDPTLESLSVNRAKFEYNDESWEEELHRSLRDTTLRKIGLKWMRCGNLAWEYDQMLPQTDGLDVFESLSRAPFLQSVTIGHASVLDPDTDEEKKRLFNALDTGFPNLVQANFAPTFKTMSQLPDQDVMIKVKELINRAGERQARVIALLFCLEQLTQPGQNLFGGSDLIKPIVKVASLPWRHSIETPRASKRECPDTDDDDDDDDAGPQQGKRSRW